MGFKYINKANSIENIKHQLDAWYDGTIHNGFLLDKTGNNRHARVTNNLVTDSGAEYNSSWIPYVGGGTFATVNGTIDTDSRPGSSGTRCYRFRWEGVTAFASLGSEQFVVKAGESITFRFWAKRITSTTINLFVTRGNSTATDSLTVNTALATHLISGSNAVGQWGQFQVSYTAIADGGLARVGVNMGAGTHEILLDDIEVITNDVTNNCFILPNDAVLKAADTEFRFFTSAGIPLTTRGAWQYNADVNRIYCGGAMSYLFLKEDPDITTDYIIAKNFENLDHAFDSCPTVYTIGVSQTYPTYLAALNAWNSATATFRNRVRFEIHDDLSANVYADYTITVSAGKGFIVITKEFIYLDGIGENRTITGSKAVESTDSELLNSELFAPLYNCGVRNINFVKNRGGYLYHQDSTPMEGRQVILLNTTFTEQGDNGVFAYRDANMLPRPGTNLAESVQAGGMHPNFRQIVKNCTFTGARPISWQDAAMGVDEKSNCYLRDCTLNSIAIVDFGNPTGQILESYRLTSTGLGNTQIFASNTLRNSTINEVGATKSIFLTELTY